MKCLKALLLVPLVLGACEKSNNVAQLQEQANAVGKTYAPIADHLDKRRQAIFQHGKNVPGNLPDVPEIVRLIGEAGDKINEMKGITSAIDKQTDEAAKANKPDELEKIIDESHEKLDLDKTVANEDLSRVESWIWQYEQGRSAPAAAPKEAPVPPPPTEAAEPTNAGAGAGSAAAPAPAGEKATKMDKSAKTEKAAQKAAGEKTDKKAEKKAAAPAEKTDKKAAAPKAGAGSATK